MIMGKTLPTAIFLMGPTASGKSELAIQLADRLDGEIISVDSAMVYRGMDIGTAKPSLEERGRIPHHLIDILDPAENYSTGRFRAQALEIIAAVSRRGKLPLLVGGTMLYFNALSNGLAPLPGADPAIRRQIDKEAEEEGWEGLHQRLAEVDPESARRIHPHDPQRIQRALEVYRLTGRTLTEWHKANVEQRVFTPLNLILAPNERAVLHERIKIRFLNMLEQGLIEEVKELFARGDLHEGLPSIRAVGYRQVWAYLKGEYDKAKMIERGIIATRQLAKRQLTWLRRQKSALCYVMGEKNLSQRLIHDIVSRLN